MTDGVKLDSKKMLAGGNMKSVRSKPTKLFLFCLLMVLALFFGQSLAAETSAQYTPYRIGVLAVRGQQQCLDTWSPTAAYLTRQVAGYSFVVVPLAHHQIYASVERAEVDFILANPAFYVGLELWFQTNRIATLKEWHVKGVSTKYGGVIICRGDREDIRAITDLVGKSFMAVSETSLGGWMMAYREFKEIGIDPYKDFQSLKFGETHDRVVYAVRDRKVDAGTVRTGTLEALSAEGHINLDDFYVFPQRHSSGEQPPFLCSTRLYPGWPMARVKHTPDALAEKVAVALLKMPLADPAALAAGCAGWTIPLNYQPVHECLRILKVGPYKDIGKITIGDVVRNYGQWIILATALFCILAGFAVAATKLNTQIKASNQRLQTEMGLRKQKELELHQAKEIAENATRTKSEFLANMSHEIRTPMNGVIAATDLALSEDVPPKIAHYLRIIHGSAYSLLSIIDDILDFSKIEAGKFELKERNFRLGEVIDRVMELFVNKAAEKGIELLVDIDMNAPKVIQGDPLRLQQILTNLISNAVKFTESGGVIRVDVKQDIQKDAGVDENEVVLAFSVKDTGIGIAPEYMNLLFEPFSQADTSSTRKHEGTGLGLSICKQLVTMMNGQIAVESKLGSGSRFFFTVRMRKPRVSPPPRISVPADIQGLNVLVVDDLGESRAIMRKMLTSLGFKVETLPSAQEALDRLKNNLTRNNPIELVMMDWKMPGMDGIEASKKIRQELELTMPIIMMTAFGKEQQRIEAEAVGINGFLTKPIYPSTLFDAIMDGLGKTGLKDAGRRKRFTTRASIYRKPLKGTRILVAEDNPTNQLVAQAILEGAGIHVIIVGNGEEAVEAVRSTSFDAVLMDIQMPRMNGYEATRKIREMPQGVSIPIIAMTAHAMKGDEERCLEAGMDGYISKPVNQDRLFHTLWRLIGGSGYALEDSESEEKAAMADTDTVYESVDHGEDEASEDTGFALPVSVPGIDIGRTLHALNIDGATFMRILQGFKADNQDMVDRLRQAFANNDPESMRHLAHGLKGSAANIGADDLSAASHKLEDACSREDCKDTKMSRFETLIDAVTAALNQVLASIQQLKGSEPNEETEPESTEACLSLDVLLAKLVESIELADPEQISKIMASVRQAAGRCRQIDPSNLKALENQLNRYDYDEALETIQTILKS